MIKIFIIRKTDSWKLRQFIMLPALRRVNCRDHFVGSLSVGMCMCVCLVVLFFSSHTLVVVTLYYLRLSYWRRHNMFLKPSNCKEWAKVILQVCKFKSHLLMLRSLCASVQYCIQRVIVSFPDCVLYHPIYNNIVFQGTKRKKLVVWRCKT